MHLNITRSNEKKNIVFILHTKNLYFEIHIIPEINNSQLTEHHDRAHTAFVYTRMQKIYI